MFHCYLISQFGTGGRTHAKATLVEVPRVDGDHTVSSMKLISSCITSPSMRGYVRIFVTRFFDSLRLKMLAVKFPVSTENISVDR